MANVVKYSTTTPNGCIRKGNMVLGVDPNVNFGPTSSTGFYASIQPPPGGWTIYQDKPSQGPSIYVASDTTDLINKVKNINGTTYASTEECLTYLATQSDKIVVNRNYEGIVTSGLTYTVDGGFTMSYPTSGSTWYDVSGGAKNATLFNSPSFSSNNGGILTFSKASSNYATSSNLGTLSNWTAEVWVKFNSTLTGQVGMVAGNQFNGSTSINFTIGTNGAPTSYNIQVGFFESGWYNTTGFAPALNTWYQIVGTYDGTTIRQYVNGSASGGTVTITKTLQSGGEVRLMRRWDDVVSSGNLIDGDLSIVRIYNRALTNTEISQNFNSQKSRFNL